MKYYSKMPDDIAEREVIVIDAMLATGTSAIAAIKDLKEMGVKSIKFLCILACPEGRDALLAAHPDVDIYCGGVDESLNEKAISFRVWEMRRPYFRHKVRLIKSQK